MNRHDFEDFPAPVYVPGHYRIDDGLEPTSVWDMWACDSAAFVALALVGAAVFVLCAVL